jgi:hypothetical protein
LIPCGSHPETDPLWSNEQLTFVHYGTNARRLDKLKVLADHPLVMRHLRVCWKNAGRQHNCCRCEKCMRTMLMLETFGKLAPFEAFPSRRGLIWRAWGVSTIPLSYFPNYKDQLVTCPRWQTRLAMRIMLARSWIRNRKKEILRGIGGQGQR